MSKKGQFKEPWMDMEDAAFRELGPEQRKRARDCVDALDGMDPGAVGDVVKAARKSLDTVNELIGCHQARLQSMLRKTEELPVGAAYRAEVLKSNANVIKGLREEIVMLEARREQTKSALAKLKG